MNKLHAFAEAIKLKPQIDKVITIGKNNILSNKKRYFQNYKIKNQYQKYLMNCQKDIVQEKADIQEFLKAGFRTGDDAPMAVIELVDQNPEAKGFPHNTKKI